MAASLGGSGIVPKIPNASKSNWFSQMKKAAKKVARLRSKRVWPLHIRNR